jgi:hypothetical protein
MQNKDDFDESNTTEERRNGQREHEDIENRYQFEENNDKPCDQIAVNRSKDDTPCKTNQHDTVLKRFKKKILRKSRRNTSEEASKMASRQDNSNGRPESFEEDDYFEGHIYEVPFANSSAQNVSGEATNMANNRFENGEHSENHGRMSLRNSWHSEANGRGDIGSQNGSVKFCGGGNDRNLENTNGSVNSRKEHFQHGKSMSLPAPSRGYVPLPGLAGCNPRLPSDTSSEDSSNEEWVQPPSRAKPDVRSLRSQSLPSPSKLNLNYQFLNGLNDLCKCGWYWGPLSSKEAEVKLHGKPDGAFLVRDSNDNRYLLSLSFRSAQKTLHTRIEFCKGKFSFYSAPFISAGSFSSVVELIDNCVETSKERVYCYTKGRALNGATFPVRLMKPISRFEYVCTLQHLCRFIIRQHFTLENISDMPLPGIMKRFLGKNHFDAKPGE